MHYFEDDDDGYGAWLQAHPEGFVANVQRNHEPDYCVLHEATCWTVTPGKGSNKQPGSATGRNYRKVVADAAAALLDWASREGFTPNERTLCRTCDPAVSDGVTPRHLLLGWDVGAWHCRNGSTSRDALVALRSGVGGTWEALPHSFRGNVRPQLALETPRDVLAGLLQLVGVDLEQLDRVTMAIDATLGWPDAFVDLVVDGVKPSIPLEGKVDNPLLLRRTEREVARLVGRAPLSAVQDQIGSQSSKAIALLCVLGLQRVCPGVWRGEVGGVAVTAIEAYPAPSRHSPSLMEAVGRLEPGLRHRDKDTHDALVCAVVAALFAKNRLAFHAPMPRDAREGWIWLPHDVEASGGERRGSPPEG